MTQFSVPGTCWRWRIWISGAVNSRPLCDNTSIPKWLGAILLLHPRYWSNSDMLRVFSLKNLLYFFSSDKHKLKILVQTKNPNNTPRCFFFKIQIIFYRHQRKEVKSKQKQCWSLNKQQVGIGSTLNSFLWVQRPEKRGCWWINSLVYSNDRSLHLGAPEVIRRELACPLTWSLIFSSP